MTSIAENRMASAYVSAFRAHGSRALIANLDTEVREHRWGDHLVPLTINSGERASTFVCSPRVGYVDYCREELARFPNPSLAILLRAIVDVVGVAIRPCDLDQIVHVNNWMMSTNLPRGLNPGLVAEQTNALAAAFPAHLLAFRSLTERHDPALMAALRDCGWTMLPSRQVYLLDDPARESLPRRDAKRDDKLLKAAAYAYEELSEMRASDAARIADLYRMLYVDKHSRLNPLYTPSFVETAHAIGMLRYLVLRDREGVIQAFGGMHVIGGYGTMPVFGYNTDRPQSEGLYRLAFHAGTLYAVRHGLRFNMSSGASTFKTNRGATPEMEYTAFHVRHLPTMRRLPFGLLQLVAEKVGIPILRKHRL